MTMGSHVRLRQLSMTLDITSGIPKIVFLRRDSRPEQIRTQINEEIEENENFLESSSNIDYEIIRPRG